MLTVSFYGISKETATALLNNVEFQKVEVDKFVEVLGVILSGSEDVSNSTKAADPTTTTSKAVTASLEQCSPHKDTTDSHERSSMDTAMGTITGPTRFEMAIETKDGDNRCPCPSPTSGSNNSSITSGGVEENILSDGNDEGKASMDVFDSLNKSAEILGIDGGASPSNGHDVRAPTQETKVGSPRESNGRDRVDTNFKQAAEAHAAGAYFKRSAFDSNLGLGSKGKHLNVVALLL